MRWVRPSIAIIFTLGVTTGFFFDKIEPVVYGGLAGLAIGWWFKSRDSFKRRGDK